MCQLRHQQTYALHNGNIAYQLAANWMRIRTWLLLLTATSQTLRHIPGFFVSARVAFQMRLRTLDLIHTLPSTNNNVVSTWNRSVHIQSEAKQINKPQNSNKIYICIFFNHCWNIICRINIYWSLETKLMDFFLNGSFISIVVPLSSSKCSYTCMYMPSICHSGCLLLSFVYFSIQYCRI